MPAYKLYIKTTLFCVFLYCLQAIAVNASEVLPLSPPSEATAVTNDPTAQWQVTSEPLALLLAQITQQPIKTPLFNADFGIHHKQVKPSQRLLLAKASKVLWNGDCLEPELGKIINPQQAISINCEQQHLHWWLHPESIMAVARDLAKQLAIVNPTRSTDYQQQTDILDQQLMAIVANAKQRWQPMRLMFYHDAYPELTQLLALPNALVLQPHEQGLKSVKSQLEQLQQLNNNIDCLLIEYQYQHTNISQWAQKYSIQTVIFNPLQQPINSQQSDSFTQFYQGLHQQLAECLND